MPITKDKKFRNSDIALSFCNKIMTGSKSIKLLEVEIDENLKKNINLDTLIIRTKIILPSVIRAFKFIDIDTRLLLYNAAVASHLNYDDVIWNQYPKLQESKLQSLQNTAAKPILNVKHATLFYLFF